ncbi:NAD(P)H-dependent oxidoreductase [Mesonia sp. MT50]|uniref:NAD(P)H-dependent oxidoreductase n=1 Tax=Mesonia profundi TaxID=3070998 RepID=A0ABU1A290_9FLAO|nr:NAD(P)H-dependent oxidoreductase [Mesonia profundi]MDQ7917822.1 NAD(P)H-dependent oxidoreductase [Mesonia profundi]
MGKILVFAGSSSSISINHALVTSVANQIVDHEVEIIRLTDFELPVYSYDIEKNEGIPLNITRLKNKIDQAEALIISVNEHNGTVSSFFKNVLDWLSRFDPKFLEGKKVLLMSTSAGKRGAASALAYTEAILPKFGAQVVASFSFPSFNEHFDLQELKVTDETLQLGIIDTLSNFLQEIES